MKNLITLLAGLLMTISAMAQTEGRIAYSRIMQMNISAPEGMEEMFKNMPKEQTAKKELIFNKTQSVYQKPEGDIGTDDNMVHLSQGEMEISFDFKEPETSLYMDLEKKEKIDQQDFMGKLFLVKSTTGERKWKLGSRKLKVGDYICMEATTTIKDTVPVIAWYTPQIRVSAGPSGYEGLPGMILKVEEGDNIVHLATDIQLEAIDPEAISAPTKGKKVSIEKFEKIRKEKLEELGIMTGKGGGIQIMTIDERN